MVNGYKRRIRCLNHRYSAVRFLRFLDKGQLISMSMSFFLMMIPYDFGYIMPLLNYVLLFPLNVYYLRLFDDVPLRPLDYVPSTCQLPYSPH